MARKDRGRPSPFSLAVDRAVPAIAQLIVIELADWNTAFYVLMNTIMETSIGDCLRKQKDPRYMVEYKDRKCGRGSFRNARSRRDAR